MRPALCTRGAMETFGIGGKTFQLAGEGTARHDMWTMRQIAACGLNTVQQSDGETDERFEYRLYLTALQTGDIFLLLGSLLVPEGTTSEQWSEKMANETANCLANLTDPADKAKLRILLASALMPFFVGGRRSSKTSRKFSPLPESGQPLTASADIRSMATGVSLSERSQDGTITRSSAS